MYSKDNPPQWAKKKSQAVQAVAIEVFNSTYKDTNSEEKARIASLAAMQNAEEANKKVKKSLNQTQVLKSNEHLMQVTFVAMLPGVDAHGDFTDATEIRKAKESFNRALANGRKLSNLFHIAKTNAYDVIESYIAPTSMNLNGHAVAEGSWLMTLQINKGYEQLWEGILSGEFVGLSIGAIAAVETLDESEDD